MAAIQYLSPEKIKYLKDYLKQNLPSKIRAGFMQIKLKTGLELYLSASNKVDNIRAFIHFVTDELKNNISHPLSAQFKLCNWGDKENKYDIIFNQYVKEKYQSEWQTLHAFDVDKVLQFLIAFGLPTLGFFNENNVSKTSLKEFMECPDIDDLIDERYSKKSVSKELLQRTTELKKIIDELFKDKNQFFLNDAIIRYLNDAKGDEILLHNLINRE